jgi:hypothetical protein
MRLAILALSTTLAAAQPVLRFAHIQSPEGRSEVANAIRSVVDKDSSIEESTSGVVVYGNASSSAVGEWLFQKLVDCRS